MHQTRVGQHASFWRSCRAAGIRQQSQIITACDQGRQLVYRSNGILPTMHVTLRQAWHRMSLVQPAPPLWGYCGLVGSFQHITKLSDDEMAKPITIDPIARRRDLVRKVAGRDSDVGLCIRNTMT